MKASPHGPGSSRALRAARRSAVALTVVLAGLAGFTELPDRVAAATPDPLVVAAGDIAAEGTGNQSVATAKLTAGLAPRAVLTLGDNQYNNGSLTSFQQDFAGSWGRFKSLIHPSPGHHEYYVDHRASGYYRYFGAAANNASQKTCTSACKGYYSFDLGHWHLVALNTNHWVTSPRAVCAYVHCDAASSQVSWLRRDLVASTKRCTLVYFSDPRFASGTRHGSNPVLGAIWNVLYAAHVDLVLNGHEHYYERFGKQNPKGVADAKGIREMIVGTGGNDLYPFGPRIANDQARYNATQGVLALRLHASSYTWSFHPIKGTYADTGTTGCNAK